MTPESYSCGTSRGISAHSSVSCECSAGYYEEAQHEEPGLDPAAELDPEIIDALERSVGNYIAGINIHLCGAQVSFQGRCHCII